MLNRICWRLMHCKNVSKAHKYEWNKLYDISFRTLSTDKPLLAVKNNDEKIPENIYTGVLSSQIRAVKVFSLTSSIIGLCAQPIIYNQIVSTGNIPIIVAAYSGIGFFTFVTPLLLHVITKKYVTSMDYIADEDKYIAHTINFFCMPKKVEFKIEDVEVPELAGMFTTIKVKGKALFIDPSHFENPEHYAIIMGFNKPMDFKLGIPTSTVENSVKDK